MLLPIVYSIYVRFDGLQCLDSGHFPDAPPFPFPVRVQCLNTGSTTVCADIPAGKCNPVVVNVLFPIIKRIMSFHHCCIIYSMSKNIYAVYEKSCWYVSSACRNHNVTSYHENRAEAVRPGAAYIFFAILLRISRF